jgi:hypothetical protein
MFNGGLVFCSICLGVPFIALRELGAVGAPFGRSRLPSVCWRTGLSGAHQTVNNMRARCGRESPDWLVSTSVGAPDHPVWGTGLSGAPHDRWPEADVTTSHCTAGTPDCLALRTVRPVNYRRCRLEFPRTPSWPDRAPDRPVLRSPTPFP